MPVNADDFDTTDMQESQKTAFAACLVYLEQSPYTQDILNRASWEGIRVCALKDAWYKSA